MAEILAALATLEVATVEPSDGSEAVH